MSLFFGSQRLLKRVRSFFVSHGHSINKALIVFIEFSDIEEINDFSFNHYPFWLYLLGIPIGLSSEKVCRILAAKAGSVIEVERRNSKPSYGTGIYVKVSIDISKPLKKGCWLSLSSGKRSWIQFKYDRLPDFCYVCGCLTHLEHDCDRVIHCKLTNEEVSYDYGQSLRADGLKYVKNLAVSSPSISANSHAASSSRLVGSQCHCLQGIEEAAECHLSPATTNRHL